MHAKLPTLYWRGKIAQNMLQKGEQVIKKEAAFPTVKFQPQDEATKGFELFVLNSLYQKALESEHDLFAPHRVDFHHLIYLTEGAGTHFIATESIIR